MTRVEFENYISRIKVCLQVFEEQNKNNISTCLYLSDEHKRLFYSINFYNVAHLLGVNTAIIKEKCNLNKIMGSYEVLKYLIKNSYYVYHKCFEEGKTYTVKAKEVYGDTDLVSFECFIYNGEEECAHAIVNAYMPADDVNFEGI